MLREQGDLLVFSDMPEEVGREFGLKLSGLSYCWLAGHVDLGDRAVHMIAWRKLLLLGVISEGAWLKTFGEGEMENHGDLEETVRSGVVPAGALPSDPIAGFARNASLLDFAHILLAPEEAAAGIGIPIDAPWPKPGASGPTRRRTAAEKALIQLQQARLDGEPSDHFRGRALDDLTMPGYFELPALEDQMPDVNGIYAKVHDYCLDPSQRERKYLGFSRLGFFHRVDHARLLSNQLISAVLHPGVEVSELSVNVHGELMFAMDSKVIGPSGKHAAVHSCWQYVVGGGLRLLTAWTTSSVKTGSLSPTYDLPGGIADDDFRGLVDEATRVAIEAGAGTGSDFGLAFGQLLVPNVPESKAFRAWRGREVGAGVVWRSSLGGKCTVLHLDTGLQHRDQLASALSAAAVVFGLFGFDAVPHLIWN